MRADAMLDKGDLDGQRVWLRIVKAANELLNAAPVRTKSLWLSTIAARREHGFAPGTRALAYCPTVARGATSTLPLHAAMRCQRFSRVSDGLLDRDRLRRGFGARRNRLVRWADLCDDSRAKFIEMEPIWHL